ncbi:hypothetical protein KPK_2931 [Klebsiella variicola]|uniref:Uncharacterized protein n=1 Tax=Klebsiella variicola (strain 342) TaxID=507522 RepID=B5XRD4_KLEV3|nr:hypothetical protein KPK_2931 [Klebsiella variicola]
MIIAFNRCDCLRHFLLAARIVYYGKITFFDMLKKQPLDQQKR